jgi:hypothetical protein
LEQLFSGCSGHKIIGAKDIQVRILQFFHSMYFNKKSTRITVATKQVRR